jgi:hypothetical protein
VGGTVIGAALAELSADQLRLHPLLGHEANALAHDIGVILCQHLPDDLLDRLLSRRTVKKSDDHERLGGRNWLWKLKPRRPKLLAALAEAPGADFDPADSVRPPS